MTRPTTPEEPTPNQPTQSLKKINDDDWRADFREAFRSVESGLRRFLSTRLAQPSDVDDCLQSVFLTMEQDGQSVAAVSRRAWLFRVAANHSALHWRRKAVGEKALTKRSSTEHIEDDPAARMIETETKDRLRACIEQLPGNYRDVIRLRIDENLNFEQIADRLDIPLGTALTWMRRATQRLRRELEPEQDHDNKD